MDINFLGHSSFKIKGRTATIVCDPFDPSMVGLKFPAVEADIVTSSHDHGDHNNLDAVKNYKKALTGPGEYEIMGVSFIGVSSFHDDKSGGERGKNTIFVIEVDGVRVCHLGDLGQKLTEEQLKSIGDIDVLMVPVGGSYTIGSKIAFEVTQQVEPYFVIPMHYKMDGLKDSFKELEPVDNFLKETGMVVEKTNKFSLKKDEIVEDQPAKVILLEIK